VGWCVLVYARTHTQTTWALDVSPGVGRTPGGLEQSRSTKVQYTCRPYRCTKYICLYIYAGLRVLMIWLTAFFSFNMSFDLRKVEDVTTISKLIHSLRWELKIAPWGFQTKLLHYFSLSNNKSNLHFTSTRTTIPVGVRRCRTTDCTWPLNTIAHGP